MKINYPPHAWLVAIKDYEANLDTLDGQPLNIPGDHQGCYSISPDWQNGGLMMPLWYPVDLLRRHPDVAFVRRVFYVVEEPIPEGVDLPEGEYVDQCGFPFTMWDDRDAFMGAWSQGKGCDALRILWEVYEPASGDVKRLAGDVLDGETGMLPVLADALEEAGHRHAKAVRQMVKANPAPKPPKGYKLPTDPDPELTKAQGVVNGPCPGCGKDDLRLAQRVKKAGPTKDRIFTKCRGCERFDWIGEAPPSAERKGDASVPVCPKCGKARVSLKVKKEGPNKGRTFYKCTDRGCDSFEWAAKEA